MSELGKIARSLGIGKKRRLEEVGVNLSDEISVASILETHDQSGVQG